MSSDMNVGAHHPVGLGSGKGATHVAALPQAQDDNVWSAKNRKDVDLSSVSAWCDSRLS